MKTSLLDQLIQQRQTDNEQARQDVLQRVWQWFDQYGVDYGIHKAFLFGSIGHPGHFHEHSDVDIAVTQIDPNRYYAAISLLSAWLGREVDLIQLDQCPFQHRIRESDLAWTAPLA